MTLAILICTLPNRYDKLKRLLNILEPQVEKFKDRVFIYKHDAGPSMPTGTKRNWLVINTSSDYFCFVDDDDLVSPNYVAQIVNAIDQGPDVVTFNGYMTTNGANKTYFTIKLGERYEERNGHYYRYPNHLAVFKRSVVQHVRFPDIYVQEDYLYARAIKDQQLLKTEVHIEKDLYHYDFIHVPKPSMKRR